MKLGSSENYKQFKEVPMLYDQATMYECNARLNKSTNKQM